MATADDLDASFASLQRTVDVALAELQTLRTERDRLCELTASLLDLLRGAQVVLSSLVVMLRNEIGGNVDAGLRNLNCAALVEALKDIDAALQEFGG